MPISLNCTQSERALGRPGTALYLRCQKGKTVKYLAIEAGYEALASIFTDSTFTDSLISFSERLMRREGELSTD